MHTISFTDLYQEFHPAMRRYLSRLVGQEDADDLAQEVFSKAYRGLPAFEGRSSPSTWLYRIATNAAIDHCRSASFRRRREESSFEDSVIGDRMVNKNGQASAIPPDEDMMKCVREFVDALPEDYRTAFVLHELEGMSNATVASILEISLPAAKIRIHRGKMRLKKKMESGCCLYYDEENRLSCSRKG